jgi:hypothetical protein
MYFSVITISTTGYRFYLENYKYNYNRYGDFTPTNLGERVYITGVCLLSGSVMAYIFN